jgi:hypothetical protein
MLETNETESQKEEEIQDYYQNVQYQELISDSETQPTAPFIEHLETGSSIETSTENLANLSRLREYQEQLTQHLLMLIEESELEYGFDSALDVFLRDRLAENALVTKEWLNSLFIQHIANPTVTTGILRTIAHLDYSEIAPQGPTMALAALANLSPEVKECGIRAFENWGTLECLYILRTVQHQVEWIQEYVNQVITDLEQELLACPLL